MKNASRTFYLEFWTISHTLYDGIMGVAGVTSDVATSFMGTLGCGAKPSDEIVEIVETLGGVFNLFDMVQKNLKMTMETLPKILDSNIWEMFDMIGAAGTEADYFSFLFGASEGIVFGPASASKDVGLFVTVTAASLGACATVVLNTVTNPTINTDFAFTKCLTEWDIYEIGLYEAFGSGMTSDAGFQVEVAMGVEFLHGTKSTWGGYGFGLSVGFVPDIVLAEGGIDVGIVFSAQGPDGDKSIDKFIGFSFYAGIGAGPSNPSPISVSVGCAFAQVTNENQCTKVNTPHCNNNNMGSRIDAVNRAWDSALNDWTDLADTCRKNWAKKWKRCSETADNVGEALQSVF